jgi:hypothetical protein
MSDDPKRSQAFLTIEVSQSSRWNQSLDNNNKYAEAASGPQAEEESLGILARSSEDDGCSG